MENELKPDLLSTASLNSFIQHTSSSRSTMFTASHLGQALVVEGASKKRCRSGLEEEFGKYTFDIKMPCDARIVKVIPKFRQIMGQQTLPDNPTTTIIYEDVETKRIGMVQILDNSLSVDPKHQHFGFKYVKSNLVERLQPGMFVDKGTILAKSPNIDDDGDYRYGVEANTAFMSVPGIIEDGLVVSESFLQKLKTKGFEERTVSWGDGQFPLNLYGNENEYKPFPEIGSRIRDDGLLFALRNYDDLLSPIEMSKRSLGEPDTIFDKLVYAVPNARVVDVKVHHNNMAKNFPTPTGMESQAKKYYDGEFAYHKSIIDIYDQLYKEKRDALDITPEFHREVVFSMGYVGPDNVPAIKRFPDKMKRDIYGTRVDKKHRRSDINDWMVTIQFEYDVIPNRGFKLSNIFGGKGVICSIWPDEKMPIDKEGNRAEVIYDGDSIIKRMNIGVLYEQYINATSRDIGKQVKAIMKTKNPESYDRAWDLLTSYYSVVSPKMHALLTGPEYKGGKESHVESVLDDGVYVWIPTDNPAETPDIINELRKNFYTCFDKVTYDDGVVTDREVLIGSTYLLLLEKTGSDWAAVSSAKLQHFGIPAKITKSDKFSSPGRNQPVRILGESEVRLLNATVGSDYVVDMLDQSNSPATHKAIVNNILDSEKPTAIKKVVDREKVPLGNSRSLQFVNHVLETGGVKFVRKIDDPVRHQDVEERENKK